MTFKMALLPRFADGRAFPEKITSDDWPEKIAQIVPGAVVKAFERHEDAEDPRFQEEHGRDVRTQPVRDVGRGEQADREQQRRGAAEEFLLL